MSKASNIEKAGIVTAGAAIATAAGLMIANTITGNHENKPKTTAEAQPFDEGSALIGPHVIKSPQQDFPENTPIYDTPDPNSQKQIGQVQSGGRMEVFGGLSFVVDGHEYTAFALDPTKVHDLESLKQQEVYIPTNAATFTAHPEGFKPATVVISQSGELSINAINGEAINFASTVTAGPNPKHTR